ncbi:MAG: SpoIIE family protein phosphatase, partial [Cyclobacteriaceae bacterium]|nr:SpoIIE family protein phosphatase [Cyclobacteriaceae bacterium]
QGIGLGILRNDDYKNYVFVNEMIYASGDIMVLYTDGITEAQNSKGDEYGYKRLESILHENSKNDPEKIREAFINNLYEFTGTDAINDDYTIVIIKFV